MMQKEAMILTYDTDYEVSKIHISVNLKKRKRKQNKRTIRRNKKN